MQTSEKAIAPELMSAFVESGAGLGQTLIAAWNAVPDALLAFDIRQQIVFVNTAAARYLTGRGLPLDSAGLGSAIKVFDSEKQNQLTPERLKIARPDALVLHPGPMIRGLEIDPAVADGPQSCVLEQVTNGLAVRMAVLFVMMATGSETDDARGSAHAAH